MTLIIKKMVRRRRLVALRVIAALAMCFMFVYYILQRTTSQHYRSSKTSRLKWPTIAFSERDYVIRSQDQVDLADPYLRHAFNIVASNGLSSDRTVPDTRHPKCVQLVDLIDSMLDLPPVSVVVTFHNEARSALLRTVVSVLHRTPTDLIQEILLVDDASGDPQDGEMLTTLPKVRLLRSTTRQGLIRSRVRGADSALSDYIVFLDSHCEVNVGWLQPLLRLVLEDPRTVASPIVDVIDVDTFDYRASSSELKGGFDWSLHFKWIPLSEAERSRRSDPTEPFKSPTIAGGLFIICKEWFETLGKYDSALEIWGGENFEISFKTWMCGGSLQVSPCSRIGHVFRTKHPYTFPKGNAETYLRNTKRIAEVWFDEYKRFFYEARPGARNSVIDSIQEQKELRRRLDSKSFSWYLENVFPELQLPNGNDIAFGQLKQGDLCLDTAGQKLLEAMKFVTCTPSKASQEWAYRKQGEIQSGDICLSAVPQVETGPSPVVIVLQECNRLKERTSRRWSRRGRQLIHASSELCLDTHSRLGLTLAECRANTYSQQWDFTVELQAFDTSHFNS